MSKKCCGIIYSDNDKVCKICGKPLTDDEKDLDIDDITAMVDKITKEAEGIGNEKAAEETYEDVDAYEDADAFDEAAEETETLTENEAPGGVTEEKKPPKADMPAKKKDVPKNLPEMSETVEEALSERLQKDKASKGIKVAGVLFMALSIVGLALVGLCVYSMVFNPYYDKNDEHFPLDYPEISSASDAYEMSEKLELMTDTDASATDASATDAVTDDAENTDAEEGE